VVARVAGLARFIRLRCGEIRKLPDFCYVAAAIHVRFARAVAALATDAFFPVFQREA